MAQPYHHAIAALASAADRRTEIRWGMRDFQLRFGRKAEGLWFPETAIDIAGSQVLVSFVRESFIWFRRFVRLQERMADPFITRHPCRPCLTYS